MATWDSVRQCTVLFEQPVLAFGSSASVPHFCWVARAFWHALTTLAFVPWTHYVDDFPILMFSDLCDDLDLLVDGFFSALGFRIWCLPSFAESFRPLGVEFTFIPGRAAVVVSNRESRVADINEDVRRAFSSGRLTDDPWENYLSESPAVRQVQRSSFPCSRGSGRSDQGLIR